MSPVSSWVRRPILSSNFGINVAFGAGSLSARIAAANCATVRSRFSCSTILRRLRLGRLARAGKKSVDYFKPRFEPWLGVHQASPLPASFSNAIREELYVGGASIDAAPDREAATNSYFSRFGPPERGHYLLHPKREFVAVETAGTSPRVQTKLEYLLSKSTLAYTLDPVRIVVRAFKLSY